MAIDVCVLDGVLFNLPGTCPGPRCREQPHAPKPPTLASLCRAAGLKRRTVEERMRRGWTRHEAVAIPVGQRRTQPPHPLDSDWPGRRA